MGSSKTTTQQMPQFQQDFLEGTVIPFAQDFLAQPYESFGGDRVAGMTPLQQQAMTGYGALSMGQPLYGAAADAYGNMATMDAPQLADAGSIADANMSNYMSPYTDAVIEAGLRDLGGAQEIALNQQGAQATAANAFGGSRQGIAEAETRKAYGQQAADLISRERARAFDQAQRAAQFDITGRRQTAAAQAALEQDAARLRAQGAAGLGSIAGQQLQNQLAGLGAQTAAGEAQRQLGQQALDAQFQDFLARQSFPLTQFGVLTGTAGAIPAGYGTTTTRTGGLGPALGALGSLGMGFGAMGGAASPIFYPLFGGSGLGFFGG